MDSGIFYGSLIDPVLKPLRMRVTKRINPGETVIDIACGTGAQVFDFAKTAPKVVGIDMSESMIAYAIKKNRKCGSSIAEFYKCDATKLFQFSDLEFDLATMTLALHQFNPNLHTKVLAEMRRVAKRLIICDYSVPLPKNYAGYGIKFAEFLAGKEHNKHFRMFYKLGGLESILPVHQLQIKSSEKFAKGTFQLIVCE